MNKKEQEEFFLIYGSRKQKNAIAERRAAGQAHKQGHSAGETRAPRWWRTNPHLLWLVPTIIVIAVLAVLAMHLDTYTYWTL